MDVNFLWLSLIVLVASVVIGWAYTLFVEPKEYRAQIKALRKEPKHKYLVLMRFTLFAVVSALVIDLPIAEENLKMLWVASFISAPFWWVVFFVREDTPWGLLKTAKRSLLPFGIVVAAIYTFSYSIYIGLFF